jgi:hypothetical protein
MCGENDIDNRLKQNFYGMSVCWANSISIMLCIIQKNLVKKIEPLSVDLYFLWVCAYMIGEVC